MLVRHVVAGALAVLVLFVTDKCQRMTSAGVKASVIVWYGVVDDGKGVTGVNGNITRQFIDDAGWCDGGRVKRWQ